MIEFDDFKNLIFEYIIVGMENYDDSGRLFYVDGLLEEGNDEYIKIRLNGGVRQIPLSQIMEIRRR